MHEERSVDEPSAEGIFSLFVGLLENHAKCRAASKLLHWPRSRRASRNIGLALLALLALLLWAKIGGIGRDCDGVLDFGTTTTDLQTFITLRAREPSLLVMLKNDALQIRQPHVHRGVQLKNLYIHTWIWRGTDLWLDLESPSQ